MVRVYAEHEWGKREIKEATDESLVYRFTEFALFNAGTAAAHHRDVAPMADNKRELAGAFYVGDPAADPATIALTFKIYGRFETLVAYAQQHNCSLYEEIASELKGREFIRNNPTDTRVEALERFEKRHFSEAELPAFKQHQADEEAWLRSLYEQWTPPEADQATI